MVFKKLSKTIALSLSILMACSSVSAKAENTNPKKHPVLRLGMVMCGLALNSVANNLIYRPAAKICFDFHARLRGQSNASTHLIYATGCTFAWTSTALNAMGAIVAFRAINDMIK